MTQTTVYSNPARMMYTTLIFYTTILFLSISSTVYAQQQGCYFVNGTRNEGPEYQPCGNTGGKHSMCCAIGPARLNADKCYPSGVCLGDPGDGRTIFWRETCTDPTWQDDACVPLCMNWNGDVWLTQCDDGTWCCGQTGTAFAENCCRAKAGVKYDINKPNKEQVDSLRSQLFSPALVKPTASATSDEEIVSSTNAASAVTSIIDSARANEVGLPTSPARNIDEQGIQQKEKISSGVIATIVIGVLATISMLAAITLFCMRRRFVPRKPEMWYQPTLPPPQPPQTYEVNGYTNEVHEVHGHGHGPAMYVGSDQTYGMMQERGDGGGGAFRSYELQNGDYVAAAELDTKRASTVRKSRIRQVEGA